MGVPFALSLMVFGLMPAFTNSSISASSSTPRMRFVILAHRSFDFEMPRRCASSSSLSPKYGSKRERTSSRTPMSFSPAPLLMP